MDSTSSAARRMSSERVSVIIPAVGRIHLVTRAVLSVLEQQNTDMDVEVIVVDDASDPPLPAASLPKSVRLVRRETNGGAGAARNSGILASTGSWIAFLDSDDFWLKNKLSSQWKLAQQLAASTDLSKVAIVCSVIQPSRITGKLELRVPLGAAGLNELTRGCWFWPGSTLLAHRSVFENDLLFDPRLRRLEDYDWSLRFGRQGGQVLVSQPAGCVVYPSGHAGVGEVQRSADFIRKKFLFEAGPHLHSTSRRRFQAYLELELAAAHYYARNVLGAIWRLARSFAFYPRSGLPIGQMESRSRIPGTVDAFAVGSSIDSKCL